MKTTKAKKSRTAKMSKSAARAEGAAKTDRLRKAALAEINDRLAGGKQDHEVPSEKEVANNASLGAATKGTKAPKTKAVKEKKPKRVSALDAAAHVLAASEVPMRAKELIAEMAGRGLWTSPGGKTPEATLYAGMIKEITTKGQAARFRKVDRGQFAAAGMGA